MSHRLPRRLAAFAVVACAVALSAPPAWGQARDQIRIVGSSTVFPFTTAVAEQFGRTSGFRTPVVESTGTGGGMRLFCAGIGPQHPDISNASRRITAAEFETCQRNGVTEITELQIGFDGIVAAVRRGGPKFDLTREQMWRALARDVPVGGQWVRNPHTHWNQIDPALPNLAIEIIGPPPTSGTRDAFNELMLSGGCASVPEVRALTDARERQTRCQSVREDGRFVEGGENDNLIVQRLASERHGLIGVFGFSYLDQNADRIEAKSIDGVAPTYENIQARRYPISRSMYVYVKNAHVGTIPGMREFIAEYTSERAMGEGGYLQDRGLIVESAAQRATARQRAAALSPMGRPGS
jgi:phosphate transport system substrate-binding protein